MKKLVLFITFIFLVSCVEGVKQKTASSRSEIGAEVNSPPTVSSITYNSSTKILVISGVGFKSVSNVKIVQGSNITNLNIRSLSSTAISATLSAASNLLNSSVAQLIFSSAYGSTIQNLSITVSDGTITSAKLADGAVTAAKLNDMGASTGQVLVYDGTNWGPSTIGGLNYRGTWAPTSGAIATPSGGPTAGDFYLLTVNATNVDAGSGPVDFFIGDWVLYNGTVWSRVAAAGAGNFFTKDGNDLHYNLGQIAIGDSTQKSVLNVSDVDVDGYDSEGTTLDITFNSPAIASEWAKGLAIGINADRHARLGVRGSGGTPERFYISTDSTSTTPWNDGHFVIDHATNNVGIGTITPSDELEVVGTVSATAFEGDGSGLTNVTADSVSVGSGVLPITGPDGITVTSSGQERLTIDATGNTTLGHGETADYLVDIRSGGESNVGITSYTDDSANLKLFSTGTNSPSDTPVGADATPDTTTLGKVSFGGFDGTNFVESSQIKSMATEAYGTTATGSSLVFTTTPNGSSTPADRVIIDQNGYVGIGTTTPSYLLDVNGPVMLNGNVQTGFNPYHSFQVGNNDWTSLLDTGSSGAFVYDETEQGILTTGPSWAHIKVRMPVDPTANYRVIVKIKKLSGDGTVYVGAKSLDNSFANLATDAATTYNYFGAANASQTVGDTDTFSGTISGYNAPADTDRTKFDPDAKYFDLIVITNYAETVASSTSVIKSIELVREMGQEPWQTPTFENAWANYGGAYENAGYYKDTNGVVHLKGLVSAGTIGTCIFTLPAGYRPGARKLLSTISNSALGRLDIQSDGCVLAQTGDNAWFSIDGVSFRAEN